MGSVTLGDTTPPAVPVARSLSHEVSADDVRGELGRILRSAPFRNAERSRRLLTFLVEQVLGGRAEGISEYVIATDVFRRKPSFDRDTDAIVRVEAARLRTRLREYHESEGRDAVVLVELPPRVYTPAFHYREKPGQAPAPEAATARPRIRSKRVLVLAVAAAAIVWPAYRWAQDRSEAHLMSPPVEQTSAGSVLAGAPSIAVLPFSDLSSGKDQQFLCDGLTEELIEALTKIRGLLVVSPDSSFRFRGRTSDIRNIGSQLRVRLLLEGSVRREGKRARITVHLVNAASGLHLWSRAFDRGTGDLLGLQEEIAKSVANLLEMRRAEWLRPFGVHVPKSRAYELYLQGLSLSRRLHPESLRSAAEHFQEAADVDPEYPAPVAELSRCYALIALNALPYRGQHSAAEAIQKAKQTALRALALDGMEPHALASLALVKGVFEWNWAGAEKDFRLAHELDPNDSSIHQLYILGLLVPTGRLQEAQQETSELQAVDPLSPVTHWLAGTVAYFSRQPDRAISDLRNALALEAASPVAELGLAAANEQKGAYAEALEALQRAAALQPLLVKSLAARTQALMGRQAEARAAAAALSRSLEPQSPLPVNLAAVYAALGDREPAFELLENAEPSMWLAYLNVDPRFDPLRSDRRFQRLLRRIHLVN